MYKLIFSFLLAVCFCVPSYGQEKVVFKQGEIPTPVGYSQPPDIEDMIWNKWETKNFVILSLSEQQGVYLFNYIEAMKSWCYTRWGIPDTNFSAKCFVVCTPDKKTLKKMFGLEEARGAVRRDEQGNIKQSVLWLVLDEPPAAVIPPALTMVALKEIEFQRKLDFGFWVHRGMSILNGTISQIKLDFSAMAGTNDPPFTSKTLFGMKEEEWVKQDDNQRDLFDKQAAMVLLLLRKELGQANLMRFIRTGSSEANLVRVYGFRGYQEFDSTMKRYMFHLSNDIVKNTTPDSYLEITPVAK